MHKLHIGICGTLLLFLVGSFIYQNRTTESMNTSEVTSEISKIETNKEVNSLFTKQKNEEGPVTVSMTPLFALSDEQWSFELTLQTHSVELSMDILESVVLIYSDGNEMKPLSWDGDEPGGHHRTGMLSFEPIVPLPEELMLKIRNVGGVDTREFTWYLK